MDEAFREGTIMLETRSSKFVVIRREDGQLVVIMTKGIGISGIYRGGFLRLSLKQSFIKKGTTVTLRISEEMRLLRRLKPFILETENCTYLIKFQPKKNGLFKLKKISGGEEDMKVGDSLHPACLDFQENGTLKLLDAQGGFMYKTSCIKNLQVFYW